MPDPRQEVPVSPVLTVSVPLVGGLRPHDVRDPDVDGRVGGKRRHAVGQDRRLHERVVTGTQFPVGEEGRTEKRWRRWGGAALNRPRDAHLPPVSESLLAVGGVVGERRRRRRVRGGRGHGSHLLPRCLDQELLALSGPGLLGGDRPGGAGVRGGPLTPLLSYTGSHLSDHAGSQR